MRITRPTNKQLEVAAVKMRELLGAPWEEKDAPPVHELTEVEPGWFSNGRTIATMQVWEDLRKDIAELEPK